MRPPVFVLGAPRSGTTLLYHMLLSSGQFAIYRAETHVFNLVGRRFGNLSHRTNRQKLIDVWLQSFQFKRSGLDPEHFRTRVMTACLSAGDFLRVFMEQIAEQQGVDRWAECTPEHLLHLKEIKQAFPDAKIIHIIRDGRDVALSEVQQAWVRPLPWDRDRRLPVSGLYWEWIVRKGREGGREIAPDYMEVHFEELVSDPRTVLPGIACFIDQPLDYDAMLNNAVGSLKRPNTSFENQEFNPVGRWKSELKPEECRALESAIGPLLVELGYPISSENGVHAISDFTAMRLRACYPLYFESKLWLKSHTPLRRLTGTELLQAGS